MNLLFIDLILQLLTREAGFQAALILNICSHFAGLILGYILNIYVHLKHIGIRLFILVRIAKPESFVEHLHFSSKDIIACLTFTLKIVFAVS